MSIESEAVKIVIIIVIVMMAVIVIVVLTVTNVILRSRCNNRNSSGNVG